MSGYCSQCRQGLQSRVKNTSSPVANHYNVSIVLLCWNPSGQKTRPYNATRGDIYFKFSSRVNLGRRRRDIVTVVLVLMWFRESLCTGFFSDAQLQFCKVLQMLQKQENVGWFQHRGGKLAVLRSNRSNDEDATQDILPAAVVLAWSFWVKLSWRPAFLIL